MSRRKQAKPRALKREEEWDGEGEESSKPEDDSEQTKGEDDEVEEKSEGAAAYDASLEDLQMLHTYQEGLPDVLPSSSPPTAPTPGDGDNSLESDGLGTEPGSSWRSETPEDATSPSPSSCATPTSTTELADAELSFTVGVTEGTPYACQFCDKAFPRLSYLKKHEQTHSDQMPFRCEFCSRLFKHKRSRDRHIKLHTGDKKYRCTHCDAAFSRSDHLKIHMKTHDTQKPFQCGVCNRGYNTAAALTSHMQNHKKAAEAAAPNGHSPDAFRKADDLLALHAVAKLACMYCTKDSFTTMDALQVHVHAMHGSILNGEVREAASPGGQSCELCTMRFSSASALHKHALAVHLAPEQLRPTDLSKKPDPAPKRHKPDPPPPGSQYEHAGTLLCNQCSAALPDFESFRAHLKTHLQAAPELMEAAPQSPAACPHCGAEFSAADDPLLLEQHVAAHFMSTATEYGCQSCLKLFSKPDELQKHLLDLHAHHLYRCSLCKDMFDSKVAIQVHFAVKHSNECKLFRCTACPAGAAAFRSEQEFWLHVRGAHPLPPAAPLRCLFCRLAFASELELQFHLAVHAKQFRCPLCPEAFHVEFLLDKHMQQHHTAHQVVTSNGDVQQRKSPKSKGAEAKKGEGCEACERGDFSSEAELAAHRKLHHGAKPPPAKAPPLSLHCAYCSENCKSRTELENHMKTHSQGGGGSGKHKCNICDELCPSAAVLAEHKLTHCKVVAGSCCTQCKAALASEEQFCAHLQQHSPALPAPCVVCRQTLASELEARLHARFHLRAPLTAGEPLLQCGACLKQLEPAAAVLSGSAYVCKDCASPPAADRCPDCGVKFETSAALDAHLAAVHRKTFQCIKCQLSFSCEREVQAHVGAAHAGGRQECRCHLCRRALASPLQLQAHLIEHTFAGCGAFTCYLCSAVFTAAAALQHHMHAQHARDARPYDCSRCSLAFFFRAELDNHAYAHLEEDDMAAKMAYYQHMNNNGSLDASPSKGSKKSRKPRPLALKKEPLSIKEEQPSDSERCSDDDAANSSTASSRAASSPAAAPGAPDSSLSAQ